MNERCKCWQEVRTYSPHLHQVAHSNTASLLIQIMALPSRPSQKLTQPYHHIWQMYKYVHGNWGSQTRVRTYKFNTTHIMYMYIGLSLVFRHRETYLSSGIGKHTLGTLHTGRWHSTWLTLYQPWETTKRWRNHVLKYSAYHHIISYCLMEKTMTHRCVIGW